MDESVALRLEEKLGADVVQDLDIWIKGIVNAESITKDQFGQITSQLLGIDQRFDSIHQRFDDFRSEMEQHFDSFRSDIDQRFGAIDQRFDSLRSDFDQRFDKLSELTLNGIRWTVGTIALFGTIITVLIAVFKFVT